MNDVNLAAPEEFVEGLSECLDLNGLRFRVQLGANAQLAQDLGDATACVNELISLTEVFTRFPEAEVEFFVPEARFSLGRVP